MPTRIMLLTRLLEPALQFNFKLEFTNHTKAIAFADDLIMLTKGESIVEVKNYTNLELRKISDWVQKNKLTFNENKSK